MVAGASTKISRDAFPDLWRSAPDPREEEDLRADDMDDDRSVDSAQADAMSKLGPLEDNDPKDDKVGDTMEITHDGKVKKEILEVGEGALSFSIRVTL